MKGFYKLCVELIKTYPIGISCKQTIKICVRVTRIAINEAKNTLIKQSCQVYKESFNLPTRAESFWEILVWQGWKGSRTEKNAARDIKLVIFKRTCRSKFCLGR